jgi:hypothetical protein
VSQGPTIAIRHCLATLVYRAAKTLRDAPPEYASFRCAPHSRTPVEILAHVGDLLDWALHLCDGKHVWHDAPPLAWEKEVERFFAAAQRLDERLASDEFRGSPEQFFQGPIADALTHVGQLAMLRRLGGWPVRGENYFLADIVTGRVGPSQSSPRREFD